MVAQVFKELAPSDYFGLICLGLDTQNIVLEEKQANCIAKEKLIQEMVYKSKRDLFVKEPVRETQLDKALNRALEQQGQVHDTDMEKNGRRYVGPHKHIIGIIGSDDYSVH